MPMLADHLGEHTPQGGWVLVPQKYGRILTYLARRNAAEPSPVTRLDPDQQPVFVLEPMDEAGRHWMDALRIGAGEPVGPAVRDRRGKSWQVHRAVRLPPAPAPATPTPAPAITPPPAAARGTAGQ
jgi:hypothetical protein